MVTTIRIADVTVTLDDEGEGHPVLLLHGFPATRRLWSRVVPLLAKAGFRILVPDLVGYGASVAPPGVNVGMASQARWMLELFQTLNIDRAVVIAHDVGSAAAQLMVTTAPDRIRGLAVLSGVYEGEWAMDAITSIQMWNPADAHRLFPVLTRRLGKTEALREMLGSLKGAAAGLRLIRAARDLDPRETILIADSLRSSRVPALVLWGESDPFLSIESVGQPLANLLGASLIRLPGGHFTPLDCPAEMEAPLLEFLARLPP